MPFLLSTSGIMLSISRACYTSSMISIGGTRVEQRGYLRIFIVIPVIYAMIVPLFLLDISACLYQFLCFPAYGIALVDRRKYIRPGGRGKRMLPVWDRFNCWYCGYASGVLTFVREVQAQTERYWCPIRHLRLKGFVEPMHHAEFVPDNHPQELADKLSQTKI